MVKINDPVRTIEGEITTISKLDKQGRIKYDISKNFVGKGGKIHTKYFACVINKGKEEGCWEIRKTAFLSRTGKKLEF
ncbi:MAG: hypothetical protein Q7R52_03070 [archaeon]|nr:hypothetical protein [archaeon]